MRSHAISRLALGVALSSSSLAYYDYSQSQCASGLYMMVARGSLEPPGAGLMETLAEDIYSRIPGSDIAPVQYPALEGTMREYRDSETDGVGNLTQMLKDYHEHCPRSKIALLGYSQGAQVVGDVLCGNSELGWENYKPIPLEYVRNVVAVVKWGDPTFVPGQKDDVGTAKHHGIFTRLDWAACKPFELITESYCDSNDIACASGTSVAVHTSYAEIYSNQAATFVTDRFYNPRELLARPKCSESGEKNHGGAGHHKHEHHDHESSSSYETSYTTPYTTSYSTPYTTPHTTHYHESSQTAYPTPNLSSDPYGYGGGYGVSSSASQSYPHRDGATATSQYSPTSTGPSPNTPNKHSGAGSSGSSGNRGSGGVGDGTSDKGSGSSNGGSSGSKSGSGSSSGSGSNSKKGSKHGGSGGTISVSHAGTNGDGGESGGGRCSAVNGGQPGSGSGSGSGDKSSGCAASGMGTTLQRFSLTACILTAMTAILVM